MAWPSMSCALAIVAANSGWFAWLYSRMRRMISSAAALSSATRTIMPPVEVGPTAVQERKPGAAETTPRISASRSLSPVGGGWLKIRCHDDVRLSFGTVSRDVEDDLTLEDGWWRWFPISQCLSKHIRCERDSFGAGFGRFAHGESQTARIGTDQAPDTKALDAPEQGRDLVVVLEHGVRWIDVDAQNRV